MRGGALPHLSPAGADARGWRSAVALECRPLATLAAATGADGHGQVRSLVAGPLIVLARPALADALLRLPEGVARTGAANARMLPLLPPDTVLTLDGAAHRRRRSDLSGRVTGAPLVELATRLDGLVDAHLATWPVGSPFPVLARLRSLTFAVAADLLLGLRDGPRVTELERCLASALPPYGLLAGVPGGDRLGPAGPEAAIRRGRRRFASCLSAVGGAGPDPELGSDELLALLLAGQDTTATALAWILLELAADPALSARLAEDIAAGQRRWLDATIHEALRLHPPLIDVMRELTVDASFADLRVCAGTLMMICPGLVGRASETADPGRFRPERFLDRQPDPRSWIPFGGGPRRCLGASLAMLELRSILSRVVGRFGFTADAGPERPRLRGTAVVPHRGGRLCLSLRDAGAGR
ncbi:cytochrome P450 [Conexibacter sp. DBS9H8]|uniref:cytochrome P450 n=1 Tax=Conexibacter sp. DBS9H8 TaxID=2937801 RepID=UPI00200DE65F|nr:cytochrome P450 [Conexibacter sp. DBS9H8]